MPHIGSHFDSYPVVQIRQYESSKMLLAALLLAWVEAYQRANSVNYFQNTSIMLLLWLFVRACHTAFGFFRDIFVPTWPEKSLSHQFCTLIMAIQLSAPKILISVAEPWSRPLWSWNWSKIIFLCANLTTGNPWRCSFPSWSVNCLAFRTKFERVLSKVPGSCPCSRYVDIARYSAACIDYIIICALLGYIIEYNFFGVILREVYFIERLSYK